MTVNVCIGSACHLKGSYEIISIFNQLIKDNGLCDKVVVKAAFCLGNCIGAVSVKVDDKIYSVQPDIAENFFQKEIKEKVQA